MNMLLQLPQDIDGVPISPDWRNMLQFDIALANDTLSHSQKMMVGLRLLFPGLCGESDAGGRPIAAPKNVQLATQQLVWFFTMGSAPSSDAKTAPRACNFEADAAMIYAAFYAAYGISLTTVQFLHWWEFLALLQGLPESCLMQKVMYWRSANTAALPAAQRRHVLSMRRLFSANKGGGAPLSAAQLAEQTTERVRKRAAQLGAFAKADTAEQPKPL